MSQSISEEGAVRKAGKRIVADKMFESSTQLDALCHIADHDEKGGTTGKGGIGDVDVDIDDLIAFASVSASEMRGSARQDGVSALLELLMRSVEMRPGWLGRQELRSRASVQHKRGTVHLEIGKANPVKKKHRLRVVLEETAKASFVLNHALEGSVPDGFRAAATLENHVATAGEVTDTPANTVVGDLDRLDRWRRQTTTPNRSTAD